MKFVSYQSPTGARAAALQNGRYVDLNAVDPTLPATLKELIALGPAGVARAAKAAQNGAPLPDGIRLLAPIPDPQKVICVGLNYADHAKESGVAPPDEPVFFSKFPTAVCAPHDPIVLPKASTQVDYEAELVVVIGRGGKNISRADALSHVAGYCPGHDVSARDWQLNKPGKQWLLGKTFDTFAPFGPTLTTPDEAGDPNNLRIQLRLNGTTMQDSSTTQLIFKIDELVAYISNVVTLLPGDIIFTGTPPGVGMARKPPVFLQPGDVVEVEIENLGTLSNPCVAS
ncbi:MAG: fumarylacetoacetate hydrolase family protein [Planctomycetia bacterium]|nr:fumarylacetoacetate hydrolase family protein [Planctomycetia bacterium]